jgi:hypothetical protein
MMSHGTPDLGGDWPVQATDKIVRAVDTVRDKTTGPLQTGARGVVYGLVAVVLGIMVFTLLVIAALRALDAFLPVGGIWLPYLIVGTIFLVGGYVMFRRRRPVEI